jgi:NADH-quinone oxidoreductase subunit N
VGEALLADVTAILPALVLVGWGVGLLFLTLVVPGARRARVAWLGLVGLGVALVVCVLRWDHPLGGFGGAVVLDNYGLFLSFISIVAAALTVLIALGREDATGDWCEHSPLLLFSVAGLTLVSSADDLILFVGLELFSIPLCVLMARSGPARKAEALALKCFLLVVLASAFLIYGIALVYGSTGTTALPGLVEGVVDESQALALIGAGLILTGLALQGVAVPFYVWSSPWVPVAGLASVGTKVAAFAILGRVLVLRHPSLGDDWSPLMALPAALAMILGNAAALSQEDGRRVLACAGIAHAGYLLVGVAARDEWGLAGLLFYLLAYAFADLGVLAVLTWDEGFRRRPWLAAAMVLFVLSLAGVPLSGGFVGKYYLFRAAVRADLTWLAVLGMLTSLVSAWAYLRGIAMPYFGAVPLPTRPSVLLAALVIAVAGTLLLGLWPGPFFQVAQSATTWSP